MTYTAIILAAGSSTRMGQPKQLLVLDGKPLVQHAVDAAAASIVDQVIVVLGNAAPEIEAALDLPPTVRVVVNGTYADGQVTSLQAGLRAVGERSDAAVVLLGDQPGVAAELIDRVVAAFESSGRAAARPVFVSKDGQRTPGHPVVLSREIWPDIDALRGDSGARDLFAAHPEYVHEVEMAGEPPADIDTADGYGRARSAAATAREV